jgi:hypothetical protein
MKKILVKVLRVRKYLLKNGKSFKNQMKCYSLVEKFDTHLKCYPNISDQALSKYVQKHMDEILFLLPSNQTGENLKIELLKQF